MARVAQKSPQVVVAALSFACRMFGAVIGHFVARPILLACTLSHTLHIRIPQAQSVRAT